MQIKGGNEMKILIMQDNGAMVEVKDIEGINNNTDILLFKINSRIRREEIDQIGRMLSAKTGKTCIVLDAMYDKVMSI